MIDVRSNADGADIRIPDGDGRIFLGAFVLLVDGENAHDSTARARDDSVGQISVGGDEDVTGQFANWDLIGGFLEFEDLLVDELRVFVNNKIGVERTRITRLLPGLFGMAALSRKSDS